MSFCWHSLSTNERKIIPEDEKLVRLAVTVREPSHAGGEGHWKALRMEAFAFTARSATNVQTIRTKVRGPLLTRSVSCTRFERAEETRAPLEVCHCSETGFASCIPERKARVPLGAHPRSRARNNAIGNLRDARNWFFFGAESGAPPLLFKGTFCATGS
ncbi:hypothetical protein CDAR_548531 [Caerostris darwini]|uniref:Uncharacterized protein n=1 Tax=Caerostris darwini TaxID=1538125 RepID=A0AAV4WIS0_9ARAC|nr:hypothetical protein CDAR_548531 [Caerostris darwini]